MWQAPLIVNTLFPRNKHYISVACVLLFTSGLHAETPKPKMLLRPKEEKPTALSSSLRVCPWMSHVTLCASDPLSIIKAFEFNIFRSLHTLIFIFFFPSRQFRKRNRRSFIYFKLENFQRKKSPKGYLTIHLPQGSSVPRLSLLILAISEEVSFNFYPEPT